MDFYNYQNQEGKVTVDFINGYLASLALLRDFTTHEVEFTFYFKAYAPGVSAEEAIKEDLRNVMLLNNPGNPHYSPEKVERVLRRELSLNRMEPWEEKLRVLLQAWIGTSLVDPIKENRRFWTSPPLPVLEDFIKLIKTFFRYREFRLFHLGGMIQEHLYHLWGGISWSDILFETDQQTYLLHLELSD